jgi:hypothetical protein
LLAVVPNAKRSFSFQTRALAVAQRKKGGSKAAHEVLSHLRPGAYSPNYLVDINITKQDGALTRLCAENSMMFSDDRTTKDALLNTFGEEQTAAWAPFYAIEVDRRPGELEYDRALAAAKRLEAAFTKIIAAGGGRPQCDWPF